MLEYFLKQPEYLCQMRLSPLSEHIDGLAKELHDSGYSRRQGRDILRIAGKFNRFARTQGV